MPKLTIDQRDVEVPEGATVLDAARKLGIDIPTLCYREGCNRSTSCLVCLVRIGDEPKLAPSCATLAAEGMRVESESETVHQARRTALELLLSDHVGDCVAPCQFGCPAQMDIPTVLRQLAAGHLRDAIATVKRYIALPAVLGRICSAPCEKICRRQGLDGAVSICLLERLVADLDLASAEPYFPPCQPATGKQVAIVGAGPAGLSAAYYLRQLGHACTLFDDNPLPGGRLLTETTNAELPREVLAVEVATILRLGIDWKDNTRIKPDLELASMLSRFNAVLLACGATAHEQASGWGLAVAERGIRVKQRTYETNITGVFAAGNAIRGRAQVIRSVADGKEAAVAIDQFLCGSAVVGQHEPFSTKIGRMDGEELVQLAAESSDSPRQEPTDGVEQAARCLHCDCSGQVSCKLRHYAAMYNAQPRRFGTERRRFERDSRHADIYYEPGKCIDCGLCIEIAAKAGEPLGLTFVGRGFDVRVAVPLDHPLADALTKAAADCVAACPTAALAWKHT